MPEAVISSYMYFHAADLGGENARVSLLIRLRWFAVAGVMAVVLAAGPVLGLVDTWPLCILVSGLAVWNTILALRHRTGLSVQSAQSQVVVDLVVLGGLLFLSGGLRNPFSLFLAVQVILGGILLPRSVAINMGLIGAAITVVLGAGEFLELLPNSAARDVLPVWGVGIALISTIGVALNLTVMVMEHLRARAAEAQQYHEEADRERTKLYQVMNFVGASMVLLDHELNTTWQNSHSKGVLGHFETGKPFVLPDGEQWPSDTELARASTLEREWSGPDIKGRRRLYQVLATPITSSTGSWEQVILVFTDITGIRAAEQQLQRTEKLSALGRLAAGVAHEINTPLGSVSILTSEALDTLQLLPENSFKEQPEMIDSLRDIRQECQRMTVLVRRLLDSSHPTEGVTTTSDIGAIAEDAVHLISVRSPRSRSRIGMDLASNLPSLETQPDRLRQVLLNLLDNALDATRESGGFVTIRTRFFDQEFVIEVEDEGEGISQDDLDRVFDPFFTTKDVGEGTGLGLYVSYEIMKNLGGSIEIVSRANEGTLVRLKLPTQSVGSHTS